MSHKFPCCSQPAGTSLVILCRQYSTEIPPPWTSMSWGPSWLYDTPCPEEGAPQLCIRSHLCLAQMSCAGWDHGQQCLSSLCHLGFHRPHRFCQGVPVCLIIYAHRGADPALCPTGSLALEPLHPCVSRVCHHVPSFVSGPFLIYGCCLSEPVPMSSRAIPSVSLAPLPFSLRTIYSTVFYSLEKNIPPNHRTLACSYHVILAGKHLPVVSKAT